MLFGSLPGHGSFRARGASMTVDGGRIDVSAGVMAPIISAISTARVPGRDDSGRSDAQAGAHRSGRESLCRLDRAKSRPSAEALLVERRGSSAAE